MTQVIATTSPLTYSRYFGAIFLVTVIVKFCLAYWLPFTGDEAYFVMWGKHPALGYYDHPPLVGWLLHLLLYFGDHPLWLRLPNTLTSSLLALGIYQFIQAKDPAKASLIGSLFLLSPANLAPLISTDIPLIFFCFFSGLCWLQAIKENDHVGYYALTGIFLGLAFFSKYFASLLALSYFGYFIATPKTTPRVRGFFLIILGTLPFVGINLYWNYQHTWSNILFNLFNRNANTHLNGKTLVQYGIIVVYLATPCLVFYLLKNWPHTRNFFSLMPDKPIHWLYLIPLSFLLVISLGRSVGLHWILAFIPFLLLAAVDYVTVSQLRRCCQFMVWFAGLHLLVVVVALVLPFNIWQQLGWQGKRLADLVYVRHYPEISQYLSQYNKVGYIVASPSYAKAALHYFASGYFTPTFGTGSVHGRQDDFLTDYRAYRNKDFVLFDTSADRLASYRSFFASSEQQTVSFYGATFYLLIGHQLNYADYRNTVLRAIYQSYWTPPSWLNIGHHFFCAKYFPEEKCL